MVCVWRVTRHAPVFFFACQIHFLCETSMHGIDRNLFVTRQSQKVTLRVLLIRRFVGPRRCDLLKGSDFSRPDIVLLWFQRCGYGKLAFQTIADEVFAVPEYLILALAEILKTVEFRRSERRRKGLSETPMPCNAPRNKQQQQDPRTH